MSGILLAEKILYFLIVSGLVTGSLVSNNKIHISSIKKFLDNFHAVETGALYRSGQLGPNQLKRYIKKLGIRTIINLRGVNKDTKWWQQEVATAKELKVNFYNIPFQASTFSSKKNLCKLLYLYKHAPKPILIHCRDGADRSGEAAALWILEQRGKSKREALRHLSLKYRYLKFFRPTKYYLIKMWQGEKWLEQKYNPDVNPSLIT